MKWAKFLKDDADRKAAEVHELEDIEFTTLKRLGIAEETTEPKQVTEASLDVKELIATITEECRSQFRDGLKAANKEEKTKASKRPNIVVSDANELGDPTDGFKGMFEFAACVRKACQGHGQDERLTRRMGAEGKAAAGGSENVNADGGYAVPVEYASNIFNDVVTQDSLLSRAFSVPMTSNSIKLPALNYTTQGQFGVTAYWEGEAVTIPTSKTAYRQPQLTLNKLTVLTPVTSELLDDGIAIESTINFLAGEAITYKINDSMINGIGAGMPTGIVGHAATVSLARNTALAVKAADVIGMDAAFWGNDSRSVWLISKVDVQPQLLTIADAAGRYLYFAPGTFGQVKGPAQMLGRDVMPLINCQSLGTAGDIILWDPKSYVVGYKAAGVTKAMSIHLYFATDQVAYRWTFRMDGRPWRDVALMAATSNLTYGTALTLTTKLS